MVYIVNWLMQKTNLNVWEEKNWNQTELIITISKIDYCIWLATGAAELVQILFMPFVLRFPCLSVCLSSPSFFPIPMFYQVSIPIPCTVTMAIPGLWRHSAVVQCLCPFLILLSFSLLCLADYKWIKQFCVNLQSSFDFYIFYIFNVSFCFLVVFGLFIFLQFISFRSSSFHSFHNVA